MEGNIFAQLQLLNISQETSMSESRKTLNQIVDFMESQDWQNEQIEFFAAMRSLKPETLKKARGFMVTDDLPVAFFPEEFQHDSLGFIQGSRVIYSGRFVYPVFDVKRDVAGFVGYDKFEEPKYLDSKNYGYRASSTMFYGMEDLEKYYEDGYCIFVEGPVCRLALVEAGFNALSFLGSQLNPYMAQVMKRFGRGCIVLPDSDDSGNKLARNVARNLPKARIHRFLKAKDYDDSRLEFPQIEEELRQLIRSPFSRRKYIN